MNSGGCSQSEPYALRVMGDSMVPEFHDGCVIIIEPALTAPDGAFVIADIQGETIFRQLAIEGERRYLKPLNPGYPSIEMTEGDRIRGIVVQRAGRRRSERKHYV